MMPFFVKKIKNKTYIKLNKSLYPSALLYRAKQLEPKDIGSIQNFRNYRLVEINADCNGDYFDFLNFLIFHKRAS